MGLGILPDPSLGNDVPGTSPLDDLRSTDRAVVSPENLDLKRTHDGIVLIPQPSSSSDDPLNWPFWKKAMLMVTIAYGEGVIGSFGPTINAGLTKVAKNLHTTVNALAKMTGDRDLALGLSVIPIAPVSVIWGRRPVFLFGNAILLASSIWSASATNMESLVASRTIGGIGMAPLECLVEAATADVFFVHERGKWIAIWGLAFQGGNLGVSIVNGYLIQYISWRVCFVIEAVLVRCAFLFVLTIFFVPETAYVRRNVPTERRAVTLGDRKTEIEVLAENAPKHSYWHSLWPCTGRRFTDKSFLKITLRPFILLCSPVIAWAALQFGLAQAWLVAISTSMSTLFSSPEYGYDFKPGPVGLIIGVGPMIGNVLGNLMAGPLSDWSVTWLSRRNGGIYEPEFRLFMVIPVLISTTIGWFGWGISASKHELWIGPEIFYSLLHFAFAVSTVGFTAYVVDAHGRYAAEAFSIISLVKNLLIFGVTYFFVPWLTEQGILRTFCTIGSINLVVCLTTVPMYIYGKRARSWVHRTPWMLLT